MLINCYSSSDKYPSTWYLEFIVTISPVCWPQMHMYFHTHLCLYILTAVYVCSSLRGFSSYIFLTVRVFGPLCESQAISRKNPVPLCDNQEKRLQKDYFHMCSSHQSRSSWCRCDIILFLLSLTLLTVLPADSAVKISRVCILIMRSSLELVWICETSPPASTMLPIANVEYRLCVRALITAELRGRPEQPSPQDG